MNQLYRIGDRVFIYKMGEVKGQDQNGKLEVVFTDGRGGNVGFGQIAPEYAPVLDGLASIAIAGYVIGVMWSYTKRQAEYHISFEDEKEEICGYVCVPEWMLRFPGVERLTATEIAALERGGISA